MPGSFSVVQHVRHIEGLPWLGSYSVDQCIRHLKRHPEWDPTFLSVCQAFDGPASLLFNSICWRVGRERGYVMAPPPTRDSAVLPYFHGCLAFLHRHLPPQSPLSYPLNPSLCSQQQSSPWDRSTIPKLQLPATEPSRGPTSLSGVCMSAARTV